MAQRYCRSKSFPQHSLIRISWQSARFLASLSGSGVRCGAIGILLTSLLLLAYS